MMENLHSFDSRADIKQLTDIISKDITLRKYLEYVYTIYVYILKYIWLFYGIILYITYSL